MKKIYILSALIIAQVFVTETAIAARYVDLDNNWAQKYINYLSDENILQSEKDGKFNPGKPLTRAEFAKWLVYLLHLENEPFSQKPAYKDVSLYDPYYKYIEIARQSNLISGYADGFRPEQFMTKGEVLLILTRYLPPQNMTQSQQDDILDGFSDKTLIPAWARSAIAQAYQDNILVNYPDNNTVNALKLIDRDQAAAIFYKFDRYLTKQEIVSGMKPRKRLKPTLSQSDEPPSPNYNGNNNYIPNNSNQNIASQNQPNFNSSGNIDNIPHNTATGLKPSNNFVSPNNNNFAPPNYGNQDNYQKNYPSSSNNFSSNNFSQTNNTQNQGIYPQNYPPPQNSQNNGVYPQNYPPPNNSPNTGNYHQNYPSPNNNSNTSNYPQNNYSNQNNFAQSNVNSQNNGVYPQNYPPPNNNPNNGNYPQNNYPQGNFQGQVSQQNINTGSNYNSNNYGQNSYGQNMSNPQMAYNQANNNYQFNPNNSGQILQGYATTINSGALMAATLKNSLDSASTQVGEPVETTLVNGLMQDGKMVLPPNTVISGQVTKVVSAKRFKFGANGQIAISFTQVQLPDGRKLSIQASVDTNKMSLSGGSNMGRVGKSALAVGGGALGGAALGTGLGAIVGGTSNGNVGRATGMGAVFGTAIGSGVGLVGAGVRKGSEVKIVSGTELPIVLDAPLNIP